MASIAGMPTRAEFATVIEERLRREAERLSKEFATSTPTRHFVVDELLPPEWLRAVAQAFPPASSMLLKKSLRERKHVGVDTDRYVPIVGDILYAFQAPGVIDAVAAATGIQGLHADATLYASGISVMRRGDFLDPHIDNSHDGDQRLYRVLNLLLYATSGWNAAYGGNLELWGRRRDVPHTVPSLFNRLVVMETGPRSWHSVSRVNVEGSRLCVSNYYFADHSSTGGDYRHVTTFAGRPEAPLKRMVLAMDAVARNAIGRAFPRLLRKARHRRIEADS